MGNLRKYSWCGVDVFIANYPERNLDAGKKAKINFRNLHSYAQIINIAS